MSEFFDRKLVPKWRLVFYGLIATASIAVLGFYLHERSLIIASVFFGVAIVGFGFVLNWARTDTGLQRGRIARWLIFFGLLVVIAMKLLDIFLK